MKSYKIFLIVLGAFAITGVTNVEAANVKVSVYYESLCRDSQKFIVNQLYPTIQKLGGVNNEYLEAELIPYGKANTTFVGGSYKFECQHGNQECDGNKVHACAIQKLPAADAAAFVNCSMVEFDSPNTDPKCAESLNIDYKKIQDCLNSWEDDTLLATNGIKTHDLRPKFYYVPWILIDGEFTVKDLDLAQKDLLGLLCGRLDSRNITSLDQCKDKSGSSRASLIPSLLSLSVFMVSIVFHFHT